MQGLTGLQPMSSAPTGLTPAAGANNTGAQGLSNQALGTITSQLPDSWLTPDLQSATIDWSQFAPIGPIDFERLLNIDYKKAPTPPKVNVIRPTMAGFTIGPKPVVNPNAGDFFNQPPPPQPKGPVFSFMGNHNDAGDIGMGNIGDMLAGNDWRKYQAYLADSKPIDLHFADPKIDAAIKSLNLNTNWTGTNLDEKNPALRDQRFADVSSSTGIAKDDLQRYFDQYDKAFQAIKDPVGANWQDLKSNKDLYGQLQQGIRRYSGYDDAYFNNLDAQASEGTRNSQKYLSPEYFALHTTSPNVQDPKHGEIGNTNPKLGNYWDRKYNNNPGIAMGRSKVGQSTSNPYALTNWQDYLDPDVSRMNVTPEQKLAAQAEYERQKALRNAPVEQGGQFNLWRETGADPYKVTKVKGGGKWKPRNSGYTDELNIAQNYLPQATEGKKNFHDAGFDENEAYRSGFYYQKPKKKGLFGGGLGLLLSAASFIPGPVGIGARIANAAYSASQGNYIGAALGAAGAAGYNPLGSASNWLSSTAGISPSVANALVQGGVGGLSAMQGGGNFLKGALGAGLGTYTSGALGNVLSQNGMSPELAGAVSGGTGSLLSGAIQGAKGAPLALNTALGAYSGYDRGKAIKAKQQKKVRT